MIKKVKNLDGSAEFYCNNYYEGKEYAKKHNLIEAEYFDLSIKYQGKPLSYCCYNKTGEQNGDYILTVYYSWANIDGRAKPSPIDEEQLDYLISY